MPLMQGSDKAGKSKKKKRTGNYSLGVVEKAMTMRGGAK